MKRLLLMALALAAVAESADKGLLVLANGRIRKTPDKAGETVRGVAKGDTLLLGEEKDGWCAILDKSGGAVGWIAASVVKKIDVAAPALPPAGVKPDTTAAAPVSAEKKPDTLAAAPAPPAKDSVATALQAKDTLGAVVKDTAAAAPLPAKLKADTVAAVAAVPPVDTVKPLAATPAPPSPRPGKITLLSNAKLRATPAPEGALVKGLVKGDKLDYTAEQAGWLLIVNADGTQAGFVSKKVAQIISAPVAAPAPEATKDTVSLPAPDSLRSGKVDSVVMAPPPADSVKSPAAAPADTAKPLAANPAPDSAGLAAPPPPPPADTAVKDAVAQMPPEVATASKGNGEGLKDRIVNYVKLHKKQTLIGGSSAAGLLILAVALAGGDSGGADAGGNAGGGPSGRPEIAPINIPPPN